MLLQPLKRKKSPKIKLEKKKKKEKKKEKEEQRTDTRFANWDSLQPKAQSSLILTTSGLGKILQKYFLFKKS